MLTTPGLSFNLCVLDSQDIYVLAGVGGDGDGEPPEPGAGGLGDLALVQWEVRNCHPDQSEICVCDNNHNLWQSKIYLTYCNLLAACLEQVKS